MVLSGKELPGENKTVSEHPGRGDSVVVVGGGAGVVVGGVEAVVQFLLQKSEEQ